jgi:hypothetical protein
MIPLLESTLGVRIGALDGRGVPVFLFIPVVLQNDCRPVYLINEQQRELAIAQAQQIFKALPSGPCVPGWLPGPSLPFTVFPAPRGRITCNAQGGRTLVVDFNEVPEGRGSA